MSEVNTSQYNNKTQNTFKNLLFTLLAAFFILMISTQYHLSYAQDDVITVYKSPTCGCCKKWVSHLEDNGFKVKAINSSNMTKIKDEKGVPVNVRSCHTASTSDYVIEGHVPAADIKKLLAEKRPVAGLAVPGMPMGSPGMEGKRSDHYAVYEFNKKGHNRVVSTY